MAKPWDSVMKWLVEANAKHFSIPNKAFKAFFRRLKNGENPGYPRFQGRNRYASFTSPQGGYSVDVRQKGATLTRCTIGTLTITLHRKIEAALKTCTVKHEAGHWSAVFSWEVEGSESLERLESESGIDLGITHFAALSNGTFIESPRQYRKAEEAGRQVYKINAQHTSQICSACGKKGPKKDLTEL